MDHDSDDALARLCALFEGTPRQGPGSEATTRRALALLPADLAVERVLDLGCGTGGSTLVLAADTGAHVTAVDLHPPFLATLRSHASARGLAERITTRVGDMGDVAGLGEDFDLLWAEGSAYSIGFETALARWRPLLRPGGCLVLSELVWFSNAPDPRAVAFFADEYPAMADEATRRTQARDAAYALLGSFRLPADDWRAYYAGVQPALQAAVARHGEHPVYAAARAEADLYETCGDDYGSLCLALQRPLTPEDEPS